MDIIFIDDNHANIVGAKKIGLDAIEFASPEQIRNELQARGLLEK